MLDLQGCNRVVTKGLALHPRQHVEMLHLPALSLRRGSTSEKAVR
jgi:hypothetical protein